MSIFSMNKGNRLPEADRNTLAILEARIEKATRGYYIEVGNALATIRDAQLYRESFATFEEYCAQKWHWTTEHVGRMIAAAGVAKRVAPTGSIPENERQARMIASLPEAEQVAAWSEAQEIAGTVQPSPAAIAEVVNKRKPKKRQRPKEIRLRVPGALVVIAPGRAFTTAEAALLTALDQVRRKEAA
jgi:hypothetical protein